MRRNLFDKTIETGLQFDTRSPEWPCNITSYYLLQALLYLNTNLFSRYFI